MNREKLFDLPSEADHFIIRFYKLTLVKIRSLFGQYNVKGWQDEFK